MNSTAFAPTWFPAVQAAVAPADTAASADVIRSLCFRAEDVQACRQARAWTEAAVDELEHLVALMDPVDDETAETAYRRAIAEAPCEVEAFAKLTSLLSRQGRHEEALEVVDQALGWCSDVALLQFQAGLALAAAGRVAQAIDAHHRAIQLDAGLGEAHYQLGLLYEEMGEPRRSARHFRAYSRAVEAADVKTAAH